MCVCMDGWMDMCVSVCVCVCVCVCVRCRSRPVSTILRKTVRFLEFTFGSKLIEIWSRKDARNRPSLVENRSAEDKLRRAEGKLRRAEENSEGQSTLLKKPRQLVLVH